MLCAGHAAKTFESHIKKHAAAKSYSREKVAATFKNVPEPLVEKYFGGRVLILSMDSNVHAIFCFRKNVVGMYLEPLNTIKLFLLIHISKTRNR